VAVKKIQDVVLIGAGNLAVHLGLALNRQGFGLVQVCNRTREKGIQLARKVGAEFIADPRNITRHADLYMLVVADDAISEVALSLPLRQQLVVHTSGTMDMKVLSKVSGNFGVFYPLQTFSPRRRINFKKVPVCIEANSPQGMALLSEMARSLSEDVRVVDSDHRKIIHLAAVFASNFTNFMYVIAEELLDEHQIPFDLLKSLISQTVQNIRRNDLFQCQTGPAIRGDSAVLDNHRALLSSHPGYLELYNSISNNIIKYKALHGKL